MIFIVGCTRHSGVPVSEKRGGKFMRYCLLFCCLLLLLPVGVRAANLGQGIDVHAYLDFRAKYDEAREHSTNFRAHHLGVILSATRGKVQFYSELDWEDTPEVVFKNQQYAPEKSTDDTKSQILAVWLKYMYTPSLNLTAGKFLTPLTFYQQRHFPILNTSIHQPAGTEDTPDKAMLGLMLDGRLEVRDWALRYFTGVVQDWTTQVNDADENSNKPLFARLELTPPFAPELTVAFGGMVGRDGRFSFDAEHGVWKQADKALAIFDFNYGLKRLFVEGTYMYTDISPLEGESFYTIGTHLLFRYDLLDWLAPWAMLEYRDLDSRDSVIDEKSGTLGVNFQVTDFLKIKSEYVLRRLRGEDSQTAELAVVSYF